MVSAALGILVVEALLVYLLVLGAHALRRRAGMAFFYALLGGLTAVMSWVTDAGVAVQVGGIKFMVGSTVFYTSLLLGAFVVYVFDGPGPTRIAILTVAGVSTLVPLVAGALHLQCLPGEAATTALVPIPSLRINLASVGTTVADLLFLAMAWEFLGRVRERVHLGLRAYGTLLGVLVLDVLLFNTAAFFGTPDYGRILAGTLVSRLFVSLFAFPFLYLYLRREQRAAGGELAYRPVLAILREAAEIRAELSLAQQEIRRRKQAEAEKEKLIQQLRASLHRVKKLEGLLPVCSSCKRIRTEPTEPDEPHRWLPLESYIRTETNLEFSHGVCPDCLRREYPDLTESEIAEASAPPPDPTGPDEAGAGSLDPKPA